MRSHRHRWLRLKSLLLPSLRTKLVLLMLTVSMSLVAILVVFYYQTEKELFNEFQRQTSELSKAVRIGLEGQPCAALVSSRRVALDPIIDLLRL